jgi:hypothetical protein
MKKVRVRKTVNKKLKTKDRKVKFENKDNKNISLSVEKIREIEELTCYMWLYNLIGETIKTNNSYNILSEDEMEVQFNNILQYVYKYVLPQKVVEDLNSTNDIMTLIQLKRLKLSDNFVDTTKIECIELVIHKKYKLLHEKFNANIKNKIVYN